MPGFLVLSLVRSKQVHYPLPLFRAIALMLTRSAQRMDRTGPGKWLSSWAVLFALPLSGWLTVERMNLPQDGKAWAGVVSWCAVEGPAGLGPVRLELSKRLKFPLAAAGMAIWGW